MVTSKIILSDTVSLPEKRARYNSKRRQKDFNVIFSLWTLPEETTENKINIADVPAKTAKKFKRAIAIHVNVWRQKDTEWRCLHERTRHDSDMAQVSTETMISHATGILDLMQRALPTYNSKIISDFSPDFCRDTGHWVGSSWDISHRMCVTILRYWNNYRLATCYLGMEQPQLCLQYIDEALSLLPPLKKGEMPHENEVMSRVYRAMALNQLGDDDRALVEFRICLAAIRLLDHCGRIDMSDQNHFLVKKTNNWSQLMIRQMTRIKIRDGTCRPYFSGDELLDLMKELGFGMYSTDHLKCSFCSKTHMEVKLSICSKCKGAWYCGSDCSKKAWKRWHKETCGWPLIAQPMTLPPPMIRQIREQIENDGGVAIFSVIKASECSDFNLILCKDPVTVEIFDALTNEVMDIQEGVSQIVNLLKHNSGRR